MSENRYAREVEALGRELARLRTELAEAYQGVLAMHAELAERDVDLERLQQAKSRAVADLRHDLHTPLHAILVLVRLLLDGVDGALAPEQATQVGFIRKSAEDLLRQVDGLLDLSEAETARPILRIEPIRLEAFAASLRGMLRPMVAADSPVSLRFDEPPHATLETDRALLGQTVRHVVSNALRYIERGEARVRFRLDPAGRLEIAVSDTGIGVAAADAERVFEEFALARRLARRLGGDIAIECRPGHGSTFTLSIPARHPEAGMAAGAA